MFLLGGYSEQDKIKHCSTLLTQVIRLFLLSTTITAVLPVSCVLQTWPPPWGGRSGDRACRGPASAGPRPGRTGNVWSTQQHSTSVGDPWHLVQIRIPRSVPLTNGSGIRIQLRIRLLSSLILKMPKKKFIFFSSYNLPTGTSSSV